MLSRLECHISKQELNSFYARYLREKKQGLDKNQKVDRPATYVLWKDIFTTYFDDLGFEITEEPLDMGPIPHVHKKKQS